MTQEDFARERIAFHEAGHAVVGQQLGIRFATVSIVPSDTKDRYGPSLGRCDGPSPERAVSVPTWKQVGNGTWRQRTTEEVDAYVEKHWSQQVALVDVAGEVAARIHSGQPYKPLIFNDIWYEGCASDYEHLLALHDDRFTSYSPELMRFIERKRQRVWKLLSKPGNWRAVEAVAGALIEKDVLSGEEADELIRSAKRQRRKRS